MINLSMMINGLRNVQNGPEIELVVQCFLVPVSDCVVTIRKED